MSGIKRQILNAGAYGVVFLGSGQTVVKMANAVETREYIVPLSLDHPNIIKIEDISFPKKERKVKRKVSVVMDKGVECFARGEKEVASSPFQGDVANFLKQILAGLLYLHANHIVHQDMKCENTVRVGDLYKIIDFGLSLPLISEEEAPLIVGRYTAPEMNKGEGLLLPASDVYMLGFTLYETFSPPDARAKLTTRMGYIEYQHTVLGNGEELARFLGTGLPPGLPEVRRYVFPDPAMEALASSMIAVDPRERPSAAELLGREPLASLGYRIPAQWGTPEALPEPQFRSVDSDNSTTTSSAQIDVVTNWMMGLQNISINVSVGGDLYVILEQAYTAFQLSLEHSRPEPAELVALALTSVAAAWAFIKGELDFDGVRGLLTDPNLRYDPELNEGPLFRRYISLVTSARGDLMRKSLFAYMRSEFSPSPEVYLEAVVYLCQIWKMHKFVEVRARKKCLVALNFTMNGLNSSLPGDDEDIREMESAVRELTLREQASRSGPPPSPFGSGSGEGL